jgi:hypothetical protein
MDGSTLSTFIDELNGGDSTSSTLKFQFGECLQGHA